MMEMEILQGVVLGKEIILKEDFQALGIISVAEAKKEFAKGISEAELKQRYGQYLNKLKSRYYHDEEHFLERLRIKYSRQMPINNKRLPYRNNEYNRFGFWNKDKNCFTLLENTIGTTLTNQETKWLYPEPSIEEFCLVMGELKDKSNSDFRILKKVFKD